MVCRHCGNQEHTSFLDLGYAPPSNAYLDESGLNKPEIYFPLRLIVCNECMLVQTEDFTDAEELFDDSYAYFSSTSSSWLAHAEKYTNEISQLLSLNSSSNVVEIAANDGYLLKNFVKAGIPCFGIEPTQSTARAAEALGIPIVKKFFDKNLAKNLIEKGQKADLIIGNNVYAHVPDVNSFTEGMKILLKPDGCITLEFPHLMKLLEYTQFDTVYHEHFSYYSLHTVDRIFKSVGLRVWRVEQLKSHGGSLRIYGCHEYSDRQTEESVENLLLVEVESGLEKLEIYSHFQKLADNVKNNLLTFLLEAKASGKSVVGYGAAAKGNTLLNYAGIKSDLIKFVCDAAASKQGKLLPGSHIPIVGPEILKSQPPDYLLILPWNLASEIKQQHSYLATSGTKFVIAVPELNVST